MEKLNLIGIKTPEGIYITDYRNNWSKYNSTEKYKINDKIPRPSFDKEWHIIDSEPVTITRKQNPTRENYRYGIKKNIEFIPTGIPEVLKCEDVLYESDDDDNWKPEYRHLRSMYDLAWDEIEQPDENVEFDYTEILYTDEIRPPNKLNNPIDYWDGYNHENRVREPKVEYQLVDRIRFPKIYYETHCEVKLSSREFYEIIRTHLKRNLDYKIAEITSDYDFCFEIRKKIHSDEPNITKRYEYYSPRGRKLSKPKLVTDIKNYAGSVVVFKMTHEEKKYEKYPVLPGLIANNDQELQEKVNNILDLLTKYLNDPLRLCSHCHGSGLEYAIKPIDLTAMISGEME